jgi:hypothetical protein
MPRQSRLPGSSSTRLVPEHVLHQERHAAKRAVAEPPLVGASMRSGYVDSGAMRD